MPASDKASLHVAPQVGAQSMGIRLTGGSCWWARHTQKEWLDVVAATSEDFANGCLFKVPETGKGKAEADAFIEEPADVAEVDGEEPSDLLAVEPECAVPENVQEPDEQELLRALMEEQLVATAKAAEHAPAASTNSGTAAQPTGRRTGASLLQVFFASLLRRACCESLSTSLPRSQTTQTFERSVQKTAHPQSVAASTVSTHTAAAPQQQQQ